MSTLTPSENAVTVSAETVMRMWTTGSQVAIKDFDGLRWDLLDAHGFGPDAIRFELSQFTGGARRDLVLEVHPDKRLDALFY